jgi:phage FluMu protein Com
MLREYNCKQCGEPLLRINFRTQELTGRCKTVVIRCIGKGGQLILDDLLSIEAKCEECKKYNVFSNKDILVRVNIK